MDSCLTSSISFQNLPSPERQQFLVIISRFHLQTQQYFATLTGKTSHLPHPSELWELDDPGRSIFPGWHDPQAPHELRTQADLAFRNILHRQWQLDHRSGKFYSPFVLFLLGSCLLCQQQSANQKLFPLTSAMNFKTIHGAQSS